MAPTHTCRIVILYLFISVWWLEILMSRGNNWDTELSIGLTLPQDCTCSKPWPIVILYFSLTALNLHVDIKRGGLGSH